MMDPIGFALESFDAVGKARTQEFGKPLDVSAQLADGAKFEGPNGLRAGADALFAAVRQQPDREAVRLCARSRRGLPRHAADSRDRPRRAQTNYRLSSLVLGIVKSPAFTMNPQDASAKVPPQTATARNQRRSQ